MESPFLDARDCVHVNALLGGLQCSAHDFDQVIHHRLIGVGRTLHCQRGGGIQHHALGIRSPKVDFSRRATVAAIGVAGVGDYRADLGQVVVADVELSRHMLTRFISFFEDSHEETTYALLSNLDFHVDGWVERLLMQSTDMESLPVVCRAPFHTRAIPHLAVGSGIVRVGLDADVLSTTR